MNGETLTGVSGHFSAAHRSADGIMHGHTWHVMVWFKPPCRADATMLRAAVDHMLAQWDHTELPGDLAWGEDIALALGTLANVVKVEVSRPAERIYAVWEGTNGKENLMREKSGGFEDRFRVIRVDGKACRPEARYIVLDYATDPHAKIALAAYAESIESENPDMASDLREAIADPSRFPAQHF